MTESKWAVLVEIAVPIGLFYLCSALGGTDRIALLVAAAGGVSLAVFAAVRTGRLHTLPVVMALAAVIGVLVGLFSGSARLLLVREAYLGIPLGLVFLASTLTRDPVLNRVYRVLLAGAPELDRRWQRGLRAEPTFRRTLALTTAVWGAVGILGSLAQVVLAYTLDIPAAVVATNLTVPAIIVIASIASGPLVRRIRGYLRRTSAESSAGWSSNVRAEQ